LAVLFANISALVMHGGPSPWNPADIPGELAPPAVTATNEGTSRLRDASAFQ